MKYLCIIACFLFAESQLSAQNSLGQNYEQLDAYASFQKLVDSSQTFYTNGEFKNSLALNLEILKKAQSQNDPFQIYSGYRLLGLNYLAMNDTLLAKESFIKSEFYADQSKNPTAIATAYFDLGTYYLEGDKNVDEAIKYLTISIEQFKQLGDSTSLSNAHFKMANALFAKEDYKETYFNISRAKRLNLRGEEDPFTVALNNFLGRYNLKKKNYKAADDYLLVAIKTADKLDLSNEIQSAYATLASSLYEQGRFIIFLL